MQTKTKRSCLARLKRVEGQVRGVSGMIDGDRYCIDVLTQLQAIRAALQRVESEVVSDHLSHCVERAFRAGDPQDQRRKIQELLDLLGRVR